MEERKLTASNVEDLPGWGGRVCFSGVLDGNHVRHGSHRQIPARTSLHSKLYDLKHGLLMFDGMEDCSTGRL